MTYEVGQKVETPLGVGEIVGVIEYPKGYGNTYRVDIKIKEEVINKMYDFDELKPYKSAHEKLIEMGWEDVETYSVDIIEYRKDGSEIYVYKRDKKYEAYDGLSSAYSMNLELSRILTQYLEELAK